MRRTKSTKTSRSSPNSSASANSASTLRLIGGQWRGRKLPFLQADGLRPTGDRIRETLFNWLMADINDARCLDLCAGSGALGLEALSRGAAHVSLLEYHAATAEQLRRNLATLGDSATQRAHVLHTDAVQWLQHSSSVAPFNIVFMDPPFQLSLWQALIDGLQSSQLLAEQAWVYIESDRHSAEQNGFQVPPNWRLHRDKQSGNLCYRLYEVTRVHSPDSSA